MNRCFLKTRNKNSILDIVISSVTKTKFNKRCNLSPKKGSDVTVSQHCVSTVKGRDGVLTKVKKARRAAKHFQTDVKLKGLQRGLLSRLQA